MKIIKFVFIVLLVQFNTACDRFEKPLWGPESANLGTPSVAVEGTLDNTFAPNFGYVTFYDHPTIHVGDGAYMAKNFELTLVQKPSMSGVTCSAESTDDKNIVEEASNDNADLTAKKITFRKLSNQLYFRWESYIHYSMVVDEVIYRTEDGAGGNSEVSLTPTFDETLEASLADVSVSFGKVDSVNKLIEGKVSIANPTDDPEADPQEASFDGSDSNTYLGAFGGSFIVKYCADLGEG